MWVGVCKYNNLNVPLNYEQHIYTLLDEYTDPESIMSLYVSMHMRTNGPCKD